ncbi:MAG: hypothetical protein A2X94_05245 [Bdellovibrionales bacterium GWB1_55_8]|nr:MAG: hypothetical protein A2X94_05245 [Bdellovibrionales bacterium GWB1_55_8]
MEKRSRKTIERFGWGALALISLLLAVRLVYFAFQVSQDFEVYWRAVRYWLAGESPYTIRPEDLGFVFKYPPWMIPVLLPFGWMSWSVAKIVWALIEILLIGYSARRLLRLGLSRKSVLWTTFLFWWIWLAHVTAGQITVALMAAALWAFEPGTPNGKGAKNPFRLSVLVVLFSSKIFSLISLLGIYRRLIQARVIAFGLIFLLLSHLVVLGVYRLAGSDIGLVGLYQQWMAAAASGAAELGEEVIRGGGNHGFTAGVLRNLQVDARSTKIDYLVFAVLGLIFGFLWTRFSRGLPELDRWLGWVALGLIVHPLAWHHSFVLAFPFCALSLHRSLESRSRRNVALSVLGICCIGILIPQVIGKEWVRPLERVSVKSWGVFFSALGVLLSARQVGNPDPVARSITRSI